MTRYRVTTTHTFASTTLEGETFATPREAWRAIAEDYARTDAGLPAGGSSSAVAAMLERTDPGAYYVLTGEVMHVLPDSLCVVIYRTRYLSDDVYEGDIPRDDASVQTVECHSWADAIRALNDDGLTQWSSCPPVWSEHGWFSSPDGSADVDYAGTMEEVTGRLVGPGAYRAWAEMVYGTASANMYRRSPDPVLGGEVADGWDGGDPWGSGLSALGSVCDVLFAIDPNAIPAEWEFRPAMGQSQDLDAMALHEAADGTLTGDENDLTAAIAAGFLAQHITEADLIRAGTILHRYLALVPEDCRY